MQILREPNFDFVSKRKIAFIGSAIVIVAGLVSLLLHGGPSLSIDFAGGTLLQIKFERPISVQDVRSSLSAIGLGDSQIQRFGRVNELLVRVRRQAVGTTVADEIKAVLSKDYPENPLEVRREEKVGPKIGSELKSAAVKAIFIALALILLYISIRFEFKFAVGAVAALFHDVLITVGIFSLLNKEISLAIIAALLTIVGYSLNDTIVIFDRIREDLRIMRREKYTTIVNTSINQTLNRTMITSLTTLLVVISLFILGGKVIHDFAFALLVGIIVGTYSSIYIASPVVIELQARWGKRGSR